MSIQDNIVSFSNPALSSKRLALRENGRRAVASCGKIVERTLPQLLKGYFEKLDDALYELADKSDSNSLQSSYFEAMRELRKQRKSMESHLEQRVLNGLSVFWDRGPVGESLRESPNGLGDASLSLVADDELEEGLAVSNIISKAESRNQKELHALNQRFGELLGAVEVRNDTNPIGPSVLCTAFRDGLRNIELEIPVKLVVYKLFDKQVMHYVGAMYEEINKAFAQLDILPNLVFKPRGNPVAPSVQSVAGMKSRASTAPVDRDGGASGDTQAELFATLRGLLENSRSGHSVGLEAGPLVDTSDLLEGLSAIQAATVSAGHFDTEVIRPAQLKPQLKQQLSLQFQGQGTVLGRVDQDVIDVVEMLFEFILEDHALPDKMKALISRLQIPVLKVAITDKSFFSRKSHPARRLLNNLAQAAIGWTDDGDPSSVGLYEHIAYSVKRVLENYQDDQNLFEELDKEFSAYLERELQAADIAEERAHQVTKGKEKLNEAKQIVSKEISKRVGAWRSVPSVVTTLLNDGWKDVLLLTYLREGPDSDAWARDLKLVDELLWSVGPKDEYDQRRALLRHIPELLRGLRQGLDRISFDQHKTARVFKELQACHIACLRGAGPAEDKPEEKLVAVVRESIPELAEEPDGAKDSVAPAAGKKDEAKSDPALSLASNLSIGTWLEFDQNDGYTERCKLSWRSDVSDSCVFVNRKGIKCRELTLAELADAFRDDKVQIIQSANESLMDRALMAMVKSLKKKNAKPGR